MVAFRPIARGDPAAGTDGISEWNQLPNLKPFKTVSRLDGADVYCDGIDDDVEIQATLSAGYNIQLQGTLPFNSTTKWVVPEGTAIVGEGFKTRAIFDNCDGISLEGDSCLLDKFTIDQKDYLRTKTGISCPGTDGTPYSYHSLQNLKVRGWTKAIYLGYTWNTNLSHVDTTYSYTALHLFGQSVDVKASNCTLTNFGFTTDTVFVERDDVPDIQPEGFCMSNTLVYGGNVGVNLRYASYSRIGNCIIDGITASGVKIVGRTDNKISNSWIGRIGNASGNNAIGVEINGGFNHQILGCTILPGLYGIYAYGVAVKADFSHNHILGYPVTADILVLTCSDITIADNHMDEASGAGIYVNNGELVSITGNHVKNKIGFGAIYILGSEHCAVGNNTIHETQNTAISFDASKYNTVTGNIMKNNSLSADGMYPAIYLFNTSTYNTVTGNQASSIAANRICNVAKEDTVADDYNVYGLNAGYGLTGGAVHIHGTHSQILPNISILKDTLASGTSEIPNGLTVVSITHGCAWVPTADEVTITLTNNPTVAPGDIWITFPDVDHLNVNCENIQTPTLLTFGWQIRRKWVS